MKKKFLSILLALTMCLSLLPTMAWATEPDNAWKALGQALNAETLTEDEDVSGVFDVTVTNGVPTIKLLTDIKADSGNTTLTVSGIKTLDLNGYVLDGNSKVGSVITVNSGAELTLTDSNDDAKHTGEFADLPAGGVITGGDAGNNNGGGVSIAVGGKFNMSGGNITGNTAYYGGGVYVDKSATFVMTGGMITGNTAYYGGGVYASSISGSESTNILVGGTITGNTATENGGGVYFGAEPACLAAGTLITLADGTRKPIENLKIGDEVRAFDHETGTVTTAKLFDLWKYPEQHTDAFTLHFSNGIDVTAVGGHCFFDKAANKYVAVTKENVKRYIGHQFYNLDAARWETLTGVDFLETAVDTYIIVTEKHLNCAASGMLSNEDGIYDILINLFAYGDNLKIDAAKKAADLKEYGIWGFENAQYMSEDFYDALNLQYMNVAFGKGMITPEMFEALGAYTVEIDPELICGAAVQQGVDDAGETCFVATAKSVQNGNSDGPSSGVYLGGTIKIIDNFKGTGASNLYLTDGKTVTLGTGGVFEEGTPGSGVAKPKSGMSVGVTTEAELSAGDSVAFTGETVKDNAKYFFSDNAAYYVNFGENVLELKAPAENHYAVNVIPSANGTVTASRKEAAVGDPVTLTVAPASGYQLDSLTYKIGDDTTAYTINKDTDTYSFTMPAANVTVTAKFEEIPKAATPTASPAAGIYTAAQSVTLTTGTEDATIHYTTDGSVPTVSSALYKGEISVSETTTIKAIAVKEGYDNSDVLTAVYTINHSTPSSGGGSSTPTVTVPVTGESSKVNVQASVSGSTATVKEIKDADLAKVTGGEIVEIDLTGLKKNIDTAKIPTTTVEKIAEQSGMSVKLSTATVTFDTAATQEIAAQADGKTIELVVDDIKNVSLNAVQKEAVGKLDTALIIDAYLVSGGERLCSESKGGFGGGKATVILLYEIENNRTAANYSVFYVDDAGNLERLAAEYDAKLGAFVFDIEHFSNYVVAYDENGGYANCPKDATCVYAKFTDANTAAWYHDGVHYCVENGMMNGVTETEFAPKATLTRGMVVTVLARLNGVETIKGNSWYVPGMEWTMANGISDGTNMTANITREELATMLYRYAQFKKVDVDEITKDTNTLSHNDVFTISDWATSGMHFCIAAGVVNGDDKGNLNPHSTATRAEAAAMFQRFCEKVIK